LSKFCSNKFSSKFCSVKKVKCQSSVRRNSGKKDNEPRKDYELQTMKGFVTQRCTLFFPRYIFFYSKRRFVHSIPFQQKDSLKLKLHNEKFHACNQITGNHLRGDDPQVRRVIRALIIRSQNATSFITQLFCH
jgi:hypothetical protein